MPAIKYLLFLGIALGFLTLPVFIAAENRFIDNKDGTVTDEKLGLMWAESDNLSNIDWQQAKKWARYTFLYTLQTRYEDWRLPTLKEVSTLYLKKEAHKGVETECGMIVKIIPQIKLTCGWVWTSETRDISATVFSFETGYQFPDLKIHQKAHRALAVREIRSSE